MITEQEMICIGCQECCKWVTFTINFYTEKQRIELIEFYEARGFNVVKHADSIEIMIPSTCPNLTMYGCKIYGSRPESCKRYDGRLDPLLKDKCKLPRR
jgi:Fe-S-cluster containining protein